MAQAQTIRDRKAGILAACDRLMPEAWELARRIFELRELSGEEHESARLLAERLRAAGATIEVGVGGLPTAFRATLGSGTPFVALLAEYDALAGLGHACGHHLSGVASTFAAIVLGEVGVIGTRDVRGTIAVVGTPMEEQGGGKITLVERGVFRDVDAVLMVHTGRETRAAYRTAASQGFRITITAKGHSAHEWRARNIMDMLLDVLNGIRVVENRSGVGTQIIWVIPEGGKQNNVLPEQVVVDLSIWSFNSEVLQATVDRIRSRVHAAIAGTSATATVVANEPRYLPFEPSDPLVSTFERNLKFLGVPFEPRRGHLFDATDAGNVSQVVPTLHADVFLVDESDHTPAYAAAGISPEGEQCLRTATAALALTAFDLLRDVDDVARAKRQLADRGKPQQLQPSRLP